MPLSIPTLADLRAQNRANFAARIPGFDVTLPASVIGVIADVLAAGQFAAYRALGYVARQLFVDSAESPYLDRKGSEYGLTRAQATAATGSVTLTSTQTVNVPAGTLLQSSDQTQQYATTAAVTGLLGSGTVGVVAQTAGSAGNQAASAPLTLMIAIAGLSPIAPVTSAGLTGGTDLESNASLRARILARQQQPPQGGAGADFWQWARNSGVPTRAWAFPLNRGPGTCDVTFVIDTRSDNIPTSGDIAVVQAAIDAAAPVIGDYVVYAPTADPLAITIHGLVPNTAAQQAAVTAQLVALAASVPPGGAVYGDGVTEPLTTGALFPKQAPGTLFLSQIEAAIEAAGGVQSYDLVAPSADVTYAAGHLPAVPTVAFT